MKKLFALGLSALMLFGVSACGASYDDTVLSGEAKGYTFHAAGGFAADNWAPKEDNKMEATSIAEVAKLDKALADKLVAKAPVYLYKKVIPLGVTAAGYTKRARKADGTIVEVDGAFTFKAIRATWNSEESKYINDMWIPDPKLANTDALTDNIFIPPWQEAEDKDGFSWKDDTCFLGEAGNYVMIVAQYSDPVVPSEANPGYGLAVVAEK